jgi:hypothetical protein
MRRGWILLLAAVVVTLGAAGCIGDADLDAADADERANDTGAAEAFVPPEPDEEIHGQLPVDHPDHQNPQAHQEGVGFTVAGHTDFTELYPPTQQSGWTEVDIQGHLAAIASYQDNTGAVLVDIEDPENPEPLSYVPSAGVDQDARLSEDQRFLFVACQPAATAAADGAAGDCRSTEPGAPGEATSGVLAYDISDPEAPEFVDVAEGVNTHNIWTYTIANETYVFTNGVEILHVGDDGSLEQVAELPGGHDALVHEHPVTGEPVLYTTSGDSFAVFDVSDPENPSVVIDEGPDVTGWHEQTASPQLVDGRALLVVGGEVLADPAGTMDGSDPPMITVLDVTDPAEPEVLSQWTLPVDDLPGWTNYRWSPHNIDVSPHGQVSVAWNHGGVWVFDVSTQERQEEPVTLGFHQPSEMPPLQPPTFKPTGDPSVPRVWASMFDHHGYVVVPDMYTGLYVLEPDWGLYG